MIRRTLHMAALGLVATAVAVACSSADDSITDDGGTSSSSGSSGASNGGGGTSSSGGSSSSGSGSGTSTGVKDAGADVKASSSSSSGASSSSSGSSTGVKDAGADVKASSSSSSSGAGSSSSSSSSGAGSSSSSSGAGSSSSSSGGGSSSGPTTCAAGASFSGGLTSYTQTAANNCAVPWPSDNMYVALDTGNYGASTACGKCVSLTGTTGVAAVLRVVDQCPASSNTMWCETNHLDLSPTAYSKVEPSGPGAIDNTPNVPLSNTPGPVSWHYVPCTVTGPITYDFATSTASVYLAMVIENARYGIKSVSYRQTGTTNWIAMGVPSNSDAHWKVASNPPNPIDFEVTDENNQVIVDTNIRWASSQVASPSGGQFAQCN